MLLINQQNLIDLCVAIAKNQQENICNSAIWFKGTCGEIKYIWTILWSVISSDSSHRISAEIDNLVLLNHGVGGDVLWAVRELQLPLKVAMEKRLQEPEVSIFKSVMGGARNRTVCDALRNCVATKVVWMRVVLLTILLSRFDEVKCNNEYTIHGVTVDIKTLILFMGVWLLVAMCMEEAPNWDEGCWNQLDRLMKDVPPPIFAQKPVRSISEFITCLFRCYPSCSIQDILVYKTYYTYESRSGDPLDVLAVEYDTMLTEGDDKGYGGFDDADKENYRVYSHAEGEDYRMLKGQSVDSGDVDDCADKKNMDRNNPVKPGCRIHMSDACEASPYIHGRVIDGAASKCQNIDAKTPTPLSMKCRTGWRNELYVSARDCADTYRSKALSEATLNHEDSMLWTGIRTEEPSYDRTPQRPLDSVDKTNAEIDRMVNTIDDLTHCFKDIVDVGFASPITELEMSL